VNFTEEDLLPISGLQHMAFCPRQCALIHVEQVWDENRFTAKGRALHDKTDRPEVERRPGIRIVRAMTVKSLEHGLTGKCDVVEYENDGMGGETVRPVEYTRGKPKPDQRDEVQLCAQALCLEDMHGVRIREGDLFYGKNRRRTRVLFDDALRQRTLELADAFRQLLENRRTPAPVYEARKCDACSLIERCRPRDLDKSASAHLAAMLRHSLGDPE
jgi:CRISPR-associated exonuclease Cas4